MGTQTELRLAPRIKKGWRIATILQLKATNNTRKHSKGTKMNKLNAHIRSALRFCLFQTATGRSFSSDASTQPQNMPIVVNIARESTWKPAHTKSVSSQCATSQENRASVWMSQNQALLGRVARTAGGKARTSTASGTGFGCTITSVLISTWKPLLGEIGEN